MIDWHKYRIDKGHGFKLSKIKPSDKIKEYNKGTSDLLLATCLAKIDKLQIKLYAEDRQSLLIILQGMDSSGKDGTIKHIMQDLNPQGVLVHSFKHPSGIELEHDYLWRHAIKLPEHGQIAIFNRSHYENVLISKVHPELILAERLPDIYKVDQINKAFWDKRYKQINHFEKNLTLSGTHVLKFFLHLSKEEQRKRFLNRLENKEKYWKFSSSDISERNYWADYQKAYEQAIQKTSVKIAPWHVIPADNKSFAHLLVANIILKKLEEMNPNFPKKNKKEKEFMDIARENLRKENKSD